MGFFKDFKEDFSEAVNELMPGTTEAEATGTVTSTMKDEIDVNAELDKLDGLLEKAAKRIEEPVQEVAPAVPEVKAEVKEAAPVIEKPIFAKKETKKEVKEEIKMDETMNVAPVQEPVNARVASDENAVITKVKNIPIPIITLGYCLNKENITLNSSIQNYYLIDPVPLWPVYQPYCYIYHHCGL